MRLRIVIAAAVGLCDLFGVVWVVANARQITLVCFGGAAESASGCHQRDAWLEWGSVETLWMAVAVVSIAGLALFLFRHGRRWLVIAVAGAVAIAAPGVVELAGAALNDSGRYRLL